MFVIISDHSKTMKTKSIFTRGNLLIFGGILILLYAVGTEVYQYLRDRQAVVLGASEAGLTSADLNPDAFRAPFQVGPTLSLTAQPDMIGTLAPGLTPELAEAVSAGEIPDRLVIPTIGVDAPILAEHYKEIRSGNQVYIEWRVPFRKAAGWHDTSALLGEVGNTVLNGHHNEYGEVFKSLIDLKVGDEVFVYSGTDQFIYKVALSMLLPEKFSSMDERIKNAKWILPTTDERITLVTCWPPTGNTHRLVVVAFREER